MGRLTQTPPVKSKLEYLSPVQRGETPTVQGLLDRNKLRKWLREERTGDAQVKKVKNNCI